MDFTHDRTRFALRIMENGGKSQSIPVRYDLQQLLLGYLEVFDSQAEPKDAPFSVRLPVESAN